MENKFTWIQKLPKNEQKKYGKAIFEKIRTTNEDLSYLLAQQQAERIAAEEIILMEFIQNEEKESSLKRKQHYFIECIVADKIKEWAKGLCLINHIDCFIHLNHAVEITIYYDKIADVKKYKENGLSEKIKTQFLKYLREEGYYDYFPDGQYDWCGNMRDYVVIEFDSYERIKKECHGIYQWRYR